MGKILSPKAIQKREKARQALNLRTSGLQWKAIAEQLGYSDESGARKAGLNLLERIEFESVGTYRDLNLRRLEDLIRAIWDVAKSGDLYAIDRVRALIKDESDLLGLDSDKKLNVKATLVKWEIKDLSDEELVQIAAGGRL